MEINVGSVDRVIRVLIGLALLAYALPTVYSASAGFMPGWSALGSWSWLGWIGIVPLATGIFGTCPLYSALGFSTRDT